jgi:segregation and condensation protein B
VSNELKNKIETLLFMAKTPLTVKDFQEVLKEDKKLIETCIEQVMEIYQQRALQIIQVAGGYQLTTRKEYFDVVDSFAKSPVEVALSAAAMETLAIIAYRQPISRREIENIRGVNSDAVVKSLSDKRLIAELGKGDALGRALVYGTSDFFLKHFGLNSLKELPPEAGMNFQLPLKKELIEEEQAKTAENAEEIVQENIENTDNSGEEKLEPAVEENI